MKNPFSVPATVPTMEKDIIAMIAELQEILAQGSLKIEALEEELRVAIVDHNQASTLKASLGRALAGQ